MRTQADVCAAETDFDADEGRLLMLQKADFDADTP